MSSISGEKRVSSTTKFMRKNGGEKNGQDNPGSKEKRILQNL